uniref:Thaumatin-like protein n=1 Tax=Cajanus cajan TaxID=3821 RepID=A0A151THT4_CAJCA|nr:hypothetical protein KK1_012889 [Cajanus cajan]
MKVKPRGGITGTGSCKATGCVMDLNVACPTELKVTRDGESVACNSSCKTRALPCLSSEFFKSACPNDRASFTASLVFLLIISSLSAPRPPRDNLIRNFRKILNRM